MSNTSGINAVNMWNKFGCPVEVVDNNNPHGQIDQARFCKNEVKNHAPVKRDESMYQPKFTNKIL